MDIDKKCDEPWLQSWPSYGLESIHNCPVCGESERKLLYSGLVDNVFRVATGKWMLWQCAYCNSAYLDPRPNKLSIGRAYKTYYTHNVATTSDSPSQMGRFRLLRRALVNGYLNDRYGAQYQPECRYGKTICKYAFPYMREALDVKFRWLPKPKEGQRLLDVGCGNGSFLMKARDAGWQVVGVDFDPKAAAVARGSGLEVYTGSMEVFDEEKASFDVITLSHVIEHVHDPKAVLVAIYRLLKPGGLVYFDTPNIQSYGHRVFGSNWRGLETPRHLTLFSIRGFQLLLQHVGFNDIEFKRRRSVSRNIYLNSLKLVREDKTVQSLPWGSWLRMHLPFRPLQHMEFITLLAHKKA